MDSNDNIRMAFQNVKSDMTELKNQLLMITERLEKLEESKSSPLVQIKSASKTTKKATKKKK
jgi:hypothetical protein